VVRRATTASPSSELFVEVVRLLIVAVFTAAGYSLGGGTGAAAEGSRPMVGALLGACVGYVHGGVAGRFLRRAMGTFEARVERAPAAVLLAGSLGSLMLGVPAVVAGTAAVVLLPGRWGWPVLGLLLWLGVYAGFSVGARKGEELLSLLRRPSADPFPRTDVDGPVVLVDSSAAMDGRLLGVARSGFLPGRLAVPRFVLDELRGIADASDPTRRRRGRRALETLDALRHDPTVGLTVLDDEVPERDEVDAKLVTLARRLDASLLTGDGALASVAELQGVPSRSLDRLADGLRTVLVPGEVVRLVVSRPGRDAGQGVGYLDDGTMVVVSDGAELVGNETDVTITSSVRTPKGRMFFASPAA
jgi:uncharacterized protein YacL